MVSEKVQKYSFFNEMKNKQSYLRTQEVKATKEL